MFYHGTSKKIEHQFHLFTLLYINYRNGTKYNKCFVKPKKKYGSHHSIYALSGDKMDHNF